MKTVVILEHALQAHLVAPYMAYELAKRWRQQGHRVLVHRGSGDPPSGDVGILHVDLTVVPDAYLDAVRRYPVVVNGATRDISKRAYSALLVAPREPYAGPVIVKTDRNCNGGPEAILRAAAHATGVLSDIPEGPVLVAGYPVHASTSAVPAAVWRDPGLVVEKFVPEQDARGYYLRLWVFFGDREYSTRVLSAEPIVKLQTVLAREAVPVPEELRAWRAKLGFSYGKFDYVRHDGRYNLLDANRTPTISADAAEVRRASLDDMAAGLASLR